MNQPHTIFSNEAELLNALSHPARLEILELLRDGESCVCHIQAMLDLRQAYVSQQLNILRQAGLIASRKEGLRVYYQVSDPRLFDLLDQARGVLQGLGKFPEKELSQETLIQKKKTCSCPQCTEHADESAAEQVKVEHA